MTIRDVGNDAAMTALRIARDAANTGRLHGYGVSDFQRGMYVGQVIIASTRMDADPIIAQAVGNEIIFLCRDYARRSA